MMLDPACGDPLISCNILMPLERDECVFESRANYGEPWTSPIIVPRFGGQSYRKLITAWVAIETRGHHVVKNI